MQLNYCYTLLHTPLLAARPLFYRALHPAGPQGLYPREPLQNTPTPHRLRVVQSEDVVEHVVRVSVWNQVEHLRVTLGVLLVVNHQLTSDHHQDVTLRRCWLGVQGGDSVCDLGEGQAGQLFHDVLGALHLGGLEGQHRLLSVEVTQLRSVTVELFVVELAELGSNGVEVYSAVSIPMIRSWCRSVSSS